jgi:hypothetical protein
MAEKETEARCLYIAKRHMDLLVMENTKRVMDKTSSGFSEYLKSNLQAIIDNDKTPKYEYGDEEENKNAKGQSPPDRGERWSMPREIAESMLADNKGWERTHVDDFKTYKNHNEKHMLGDNIHPECAFCKCEQVVREEILPLMMKEAKSPITFSKKDVETVAFFGWCNGHFWGDRIEEAPLRNDWEKDVKKNDYIEAAKKLLSSCGFKSEEEVIVPCLQRLLTEVAATPTQATPIAHAQRTLLESIDQVINYIKAAKLRKEK